MRSDWNHFACYLVPLVKWHGEAALPGWRGRLVRFVSMPVVASAFPNPAALQRLAGAVLIETHDE